jgi:membrane-bound transcription factor site-1 protease
MAATHRDSLQKLLDAEGWEWVERKNPAMAFPTDFAVIKAPGLQLQMMRRRFQGMQSVKDVQPERMMTRDIQGLKIAPVQGDILHGENVARNPLPKGHFEPCSQDDPVAAVGPNCVRKRPGRLQTRPTFSLEDNVLQNNNNANIDPTADRGKNIDFSFPLDNATFALSSGSRRILLQGRSLPNVIAAHKLWALGFTGAEVKIGVFDTGIKADHPDVKNIVERTNWTHEDSLEDGLGHGSFVAGVIAGTSQSCPGLAPDILLHTFRVFTNDQVSFTSWFLDAFNYAIATKMDVVNLSIGGPDYLDEPFVDKVREVTGAGIVMVSAIGNDGPLYGTLNNPADQGDVIGVGGVDWHGALAGFSSRGMTTWELPLGYGRSKPDVVAPGKEVSGSRIDGGCRTLSGTSVASPVVAGAAGLLVSTLPRERRHVVNPASIKQALIEGADKLPGLNMYEQGQGRLDVAGAYEVLKDYQPRASLVPAALDLTECPYAWPHCRQPLYASSMPTMFNATLLNGMGVVGELESSPVWSSGDEGGDMLDVRFEWSKRLWPWSGYLAIFLRVKPEGANFTGTASGNVTFTVVSPPALGESEPRRSKVVWPVKAEVIPTPPKSQRVLWDQFHSVRYPPAYIPRDDLSVRHDILDWHGDHLHTNYHDMYDALRNAGYYVEVLASPATCFDASNYAALMIVDSEDEFYPEEIDKLAIDVQQGGLGLLVFSDWYDLHTIQKIRFYDDNTRSWWDAATGGANVPALNDLLAPLGAAFAGGTHNVAIDLGVEGMESFRMASGSGIAALPSESYVFTVKKSQDRKNNVRRGQQNDDSEHEGTEEATEEESFAVLGLAPAGKGRLVLYGDSNCLDSSHQSSKCYDMLLEAITYATNGTGKLAASHALHANGSFGSSESLPRRRDDYDFTQASFVLRNPLRCYSNAPLEAQGLTYQSKAAMSDATNEGNSEMDIDHSRLESGSSLVEGAGDADVEDTIVSPLKAKNESFSRDIAAEQTQHGNVDWRGKEQGPAIHGLVEDGGGLEETRSEEGRHGGLLGQLGLPQVISVVHLSQFFSVLGAAGLVALWSVAHRRREQAAMQGVVVNGAARRSPGLPVFIRRQERAE